MPFLSMSFVFFLLFIVLAIVLLLFLGAFNFVMGILKAIFSLGNKTPNQTQEPSQAMHRPFKKSNVLFDKNEAEDADYEEIK